VKGYGQELEAHCRWPDAGPYLTSLVIGVDHDG
jgi:hypothetical protein